MDISLEFLAHPILNIQPEYVHGIRSAFQQNLQTHAPAEFGKKRSGFFLPLSQSHDFLEKIYATDNPKAAIFGWSAYIEDDDQFINIVNVNGPITRNGGACSIGSKQHRDQVQFALSRPNCIGNIFYIDTPGGSAFSKNDYAQAIEMLHNAGMKAYAIVDGNAYSAGQALAAMCDEVYYTHEKDGFGCIGTMAAFYTQKNGDKNQYTNETYRELYDPESFDKNAEFRSLANDDDESAIIEELRKDGEEFRSLVKSHRPNVTDDMLHGKTFTAKEVEGILNDGKRTLAEMIQIIADEYTAKQTEPSSAPQGDPSQTANQNTNNNNLINMNTPYINAAIGNELIVKEGGSYFVETMIQQVEDALAANADAQQSLTSATATIEGLNGTIAQLKEQLATLTQEKQTALDLNTSLTSERDTLASEKATLAEEKSTLETQLAEAKQNATASETDLNAKVTELTQQLAERDTTIAELQARGTQAPTPAPQEPAKEPQSQSASAFQGYDPSLSVEENRKRIQALTPQQHKL